MSPVLRVVFALAFLGGVNAVTGQDWPMRGGSDSRNPVRAEVRLRNDWSSMEEIEESGRIKWSAEIGSWSCGDPAVSDGLVWIGTNNSRPRDSSKTNDAGVLMCFRESDGKFLYQYVAPRREGGRTVDWPSTCIASTPHIEDNRIYFCTNRTETVCLDIQPLLDEQGEPKVVWKVDMIDQFGVIPAVIEIGYRNRQCSPAAFGDYIYVNTTHSPNAQHHEDLDASGLKPPSLICLEKKTGKMKWSDNSPGNRMLGPQLGSPTVLRAGGRDQVVMGQGDGWVRSFDCLTGELIWKFDMNRKIERLAIDTEASFFELGTHSRQVVSEPVFVDGRLYLVGGYEYSYSGTTGRLCCVDPGKTGDLSPNVFSSEKKIVANPDSGLIWEFGSSIASPERKRADLQNPNKMHSSMSSVAVSKDFVVAADMSGYVHCLERENGKRHWTYDAFDNIYSSPLVLGGKIMIGNTWGVLLIPMEKKLNVDEIVELETPSSVQASCIYANKTVYISTTDRLIALKCD